MFHSRAKQQFSRLTPSFFLWQVRQDTLPKTKQPWELITMFAQSQQTPMVDGMQHTESSETYDSDPETCESDCESDSVTTIDYTTCTNDSHLSHQCCPMNPSDPTSPWVWTAACAMLLVSAGLVLRQSR